MLKKKRRAVACIGDLQCPLGALEANGHSNNQEDLTLARFPWHHFGVLVGSDFQLTHRQGADWMALWRTFMLLPPTYLSPTERYITRLMTYFDLTKAPAPPTLPMLEAIASRGPYGARFFWTQMR